MLIEDLLNKYNMKKTFARKVILEFLYTSKEGVSAELIFEHCNSKDYNINLSTVYRTLEVFVEKGLVEKFDIGNRKYTYAFKEESHKHTIECSLCHKEIEMDCPIKLLEEIIKNKTGFIMMEHELNIKGVCSQCSKKE